MLLALVIVPFNLRLILIVTGMILLFLLAKHQLSRELLLVGRSIISTLTMLRLLVVVIGSVIRRLKPGSGWISSWWLISIR